MEEIEAALIFYNHSLYCKNWNANLLVFLSPILKHILYLLAFNIT